jgi:diaminopimelate decarboxylase
MKIDKLVVQTEHVKIQNNELIFSGKKAKELIEEFGSPLYLYCEDIIRKNCQRLKASVSYPNFIINYSIKANSNISLLRIISEESIHAGVISPGEIFTAMQAGYPGSDIFYVSNNASREEFLFASEHNVRTSVDSLSQLKLFGKTLPGKKVAVRINPGIGKGHHKKVVTGGKRTKFGVHLSQTEDIKRIAGKYDLQINELNMHIGSNFIDYTSYLEAAGVLLDLAMDFDELEYIDIGGGLGISYNDENLELDIETMGDALSRLFNDFAGKYGKNITFCIEPGRYPVAESGILLTKVCDRKDNQTRTFIGTDCGFNILMRPMVYGSYHEIINCNRIKGETELVDVCGNICESGDLLAEDRNVTVSRVNDTLAILDTGAYGYSMASTYNCRVRPAEVLLEKDGNIRLVRRRETLDDLVSNQVF